jgi:hypothetical protein
VGAEVGDAVGSVTRAYVLGLLHDFVVAVAEGLPLPAWFGDDFEVRLQPAASWWVHECWVRLGWWDGERLGGRVTDLGMAALTERGLGVD